MIITLAIRSLFGRPIRSAVLAGGFGLGVSVMAALLCLHGLATPGIVVGFNGVVGFTGGATLPVGGAILALGALSALRRPAAVRPLLDERGEPLHERGVTQFPGIYFLDLRWLYKQKSHFLSFGGPAEDAAYLAEQIMVRN